MQEYIEMRDFSAPENSDNTDDIIINRLVPLYRGHTINYVDKECVFKIGQIQSLNISREDIYTLAKFKSLHKRIMFKQTPKDNAETLFFKTKWIKLQEFNICNFDSNPCQAWLMLPICQVDNLKNIDKYFGMNEMKTIFNVFDSISYRKIANDCDWCRLTINFCQSSTSRVTNMYETDDKYSKFIKKNLDKYNDLVNYLKLDYKIKFIYEIKYFCIRSCPDDCSNETLTYQICPEIISIVFKK